MVEEWTHLPRADGSRRIAPCSASYVCPPVLDKVFRPLERHVHWHHFTYFRLLVVAIACMWGRRHVANLYRYLDVQHPRTRFNTCFLVDRWDPAAALRQKARELLLALQPQPGDTVYLMIDDAQKATRGSHIDAVAKMQDPHPRCLHPRASLCVCHLGRP